LAELAKRAKKGIRPQSHPPELAALAQAVDAHLVKSAR
jgi:hypothetical protein